MEFISIIKVDIYRTVTYKYLIYTCPIKFLTMKSVLIILLSTLTVFFTSLVTPSVKTGKTPSLDFGPNVLIFDPAMPMDTIQSRVNRVFHQQESSQFGPGRYAFLIHPGNYNLDINVGFYTEVLGLGLTPDAVSITGQVHSEADWMRGNATQTFWRSVAGMSVTPTAGTNRWATSQATPFRRMHIKGNLVLDDGGWSSGGFIADSRIDSTIISGSQQQYFTRNSFMGKWKGASWNMVFVGDVNPPAETWPNPPYTVVTKTPVIREKPFLYVDKKGKYFVMVPPLVKKASIGTSWENGQKPGSSVSIDKFYIALAGKDNAASINAALIKGKHLLLTPGLYHLEGSIKVTRPGTIVLGIGLPSLITDNGTPAFEVADVDGVKIGGFMVEATTTNSPNLVIIGEPGSTKDHSADPTCMWDIFCRAGGAFNGMASCFVTINSNDVIGDHFWLWRADHGKGAGWNSNKNANGLIVHGNNVTIYGLFVEHTQEYQTLWYGENGRVYFYQCEMPYDPPTQDAWMRGEVKGYPGYKVDNSVKTHEAWGIGVYCVLRNKALVAENGIEAPNNPGIRMHHVFTINLGGGINHVINDIGGKAPSKVNEFPPQ